MNLKKISNITKSILLSRDQKSLKIYKRLINENKTLTYEQIKLKQFDKLKTLIWHAYETVPYYKKIFDENKIVTFGNLNINKFSDIQKIPILNKDQLKSNFDELISSKYKNDKTIYTNRSGGSTGEPVKLLQNSHYRSNAEANYHYVKYLRGISPSDRIMKLWGAQRDIKKTLFIKDFINNKFIYNSFNLDDERIKSFIHLIQKLQPDIIEAYSASLFEVAKYMNSNDLSINQTVELHTSASNLFPEMRTEIESAFNSKVFDHYGGREVSSIATQCSKHSGYHILMDHNFVEVLNENGKVNVPREEGNVILTNLNNYVMPLIRYNFGDRATYQGNTNCGCGCKYEKLESINGRQEETIITQSGKKITGIFFIQLMGVYIGYQEIDLFQIIQNSTSELKIRIKTQKQKSLTTEQEEKIIKSILNIVGEEMKIDIEYVKNIEKTSTGKYRYIISRL